MTDTARIWRAGSKTIELARPVVLGIVNVTPDSFSDGGQFFSADDAIAHGLRLADDGADVLDIGGESTRPGAQGVNEDEELRRVIPVIEGLRRQLPGMPLSVDTVKARVAERALAAGADVVNDVSGLRLDETMIALCSRTKCGVVLMHSRGTVAEMASYVHANYGADVTGDVRMALLKEAQKAVDAGIGREHIVLDPGFGFSKRTEHSLAILRDLRRVLELGYPIMVGISRKRITAELGGGTDLQQRDIVSAGLSVVALLRGAMLFRMHDVRTARLMLDAAWRAA